MTHDLIQHPNRRPSSETSPPQDESRLPGGSVLGCPGSFRVRIDGLPETLVANHEVEYTVTVENASEIPMHPWFLVETRIADRLPDQVNVVEPSPVEPHARLDVRRTAEFPPGSVTLQVAAVAVGARGRVAVQATDVTRQVRSTPLQCPEPSFSE